jgi:carbonic anhydrase
MGALLDPVGNIVQMVEMIRVNPLIPKNVPIHGMIFDPDSGRLELLTNGYS